MTTFSETSPAAGLHTIGAVCERLRDEFPDISISKIRFLEAEGLISPERAPSGYRRYDTADVERLRKTSTELLARHCQLILESLAPPSVN